MPECGPSPDPYALPPELVEAIKDEEYACLTLATDQGTALLAKLPASEIDALRGTFPIQLQHELFGHPASPVIRVTATLYDDPTQPFLVETFINVDDDKQRDFDGAKHDVMAEIRLNQPHGAENDPT